MPGPWERYQRPNAAPAQPAAPRASATIDQLFPALVAQESGGQAGARGPMTQYGQALGRTQMLPATAREMAQRLGEPWRPELLTGTTPEAAAYQDRLGRAYLQEGFDRTGNAEDALRYYHGGPDRRLWGPKTESYVREVMARVNGSQARPITTENGPWARYAGAPAANPQAAAEAPSAPPEIDINAGVQNIDGRAIQTGGIDLGPWDQFQADQRKSQQERETLRARRADPAYQAEYADARARSENVPAWIENLVQGGTLGAVPYIEGGLKWLAAPNGDRALAAQAGRDASRDRQAALLHDDPTGTMGMQLVGGLLTPGLKGTGDWIGSATGAERLSRAALVGGGYGAVSGALNSSGDAENRVKQTLLGGATGLATGGLLDAGAQRAFGAASRSAAPSAARLLSREGVNLTPGQMLQSTPVVGPMIRGLEDGASSIPLVGSAIAGARNEGVESFNRAVLNRALAPIGERLPNKAAVGYEGVAEVQRRLGSAYDDILPRVSAQLDQPLYEDIAKVLDNAAAEMPEDMLVQLRRVLENRVFRNVDQADATITGDQFKRIESELGALARTRRNAQDPAVQSFGEAVSDIQGAVREMVARQNPSEAARIRQINEGYANLVRIEKAAGSTASQATEGVFTPSQLGIAAAQGSSRSSRATGGALLQDMAVAGRAVLPNKVGDSGTATRGAVTGLLGGAAAGALSPALAIPVIASAVTYSKPAQAALNAIYRATDSRAAASALAELQRFAGRNPALQPYYQAAVAHVQDAFASPEPAQTPAATGLLSPTR